MLSAKDIESGKILIPQDCRRISIEDYNSIFKNYNLKINDILLTIVGTIGRVAMVDNLTNKYALQRSVAIIRVNSLNHPLFIFYLLQTNNIKKQYYSKMNQSAQGGIYLDSLNKLSFKNTILSEQEKIAKFLSIVDKRIEKQRQLVESLKKYKRGLFKCIFDRLSNCSVCPLENVANLVKGTQLNKIDMISDGKFYVLNGGITPSGRTNSYNTEENTISISEGGNSCGYVNYNTQPFWSGGHCYTLQNISNFMNKRFLWHYLKFQENNIMMLRIGSGLPNIQKSSLLKFLILVPKLEMQNKYAKLFDAIEYMETKQLEVLHNLNLLKKSLLQQMFI